VIGAGGGFVLVPLLLLIYPDYGPERVTSISLAVVWANATSGSIAYARQNRIDYVTGALFAASSVPGVVAGALLVHLVPQRLFSILFAALLGGVVVLLLRRPSMTLREPLRGRGVLVRTMIAADGISYRYGYRIWQGVAISLGIGFISSLFGIGGGIVHVPVMIVLFHIPVPVAVATSHFVLAFMAGGGTIVHLANGTLAGEQLRQAVALGAGAVAGAQIGAWLSHRLPGRAVLRLLALALVGLALRLFVKGIFHV
jgi:uncharacterized membrane protein YfcA